ncbi:tubulin tyrosine ligase 3-like [Podargus strigoides]
MMLGGSVDTVSGPPSSVRQRQAGHTTTASHHGRHHTLLDPERLKRVRLHVERAIKEKKIFAVQGPYPVIRRLLRARGWVERKLPSAGRLGRQPEQQRGGQEKQLQEEEGGDGAEQEETVLDPQLGLACCGAQPSLGTPEPLRSPRPPEEEEEEEEQWDEDPDGIQKVMSYLLRNQVPYFIWTIRHNAVDCQLLQQDQVFNHYTGVSAFATKEGLCLNLQNLPWFDQADPYTFFPRCYRLGAAEERQAFIEDFRLTAARSLLKVALERAGNALRETEQPPKSSEGPEGPPLPPQLVEEALQVCRQHLATLGHQDIDRDSMSPCMMGTDWDRFLQDFYRVVHEGAGLVLSEAQQEQCQTVLQCLEERLPQLAMEGDHNVWILKPGAKSRGRGIVCIARLEEVLQLAGSCMTPFARVGKWVVQKYVERLLLIFGTKFDIRQWFLVTNWNPLTVWFYQDSYLRFCSWPFSLRHLDSTRHLCNVSIQKHYRPAQGQHPRLPPDRIWSCQQLQAYLAQVGRADAWHQVMVPGMKAAVLGALRSAQDLVVSRKGSFELYGADFVFGEDCQPWLLEINTSPTMAPSSVVTGRLCARVQKDTLRVVIDRRNDPTCSTGAFELIYKEAAVPMPRYTGLKLMVKGCSLRKTWLAQHRSCSKAPTTAPSTSQSPELLSLRGRAIHIPQLEAPRGELAPRGRRSHHRLPVSAPVAPPQPQVALPQLRVRPLAKMPILPPQGALAGSSRGPTGLPPASRPARVLRLPVLEPCAQAPCPGRRRMVAPRGTQKSCDAKGQPGGGGPCLPQLGQQHRTQLHPIPIRPHLSVGAPNPPPVGTVKHGCAREPVSVPLCAGECGHNRGPTWDGAVGRNRGHRRHKKTPPLLPVCGRGYQTGPS